MGAFRPVNNRLKPKTTSHHGSSHSTPKCRQGLEDEGQSRHTATANPTRHGIQSND